jgi:hypothetical protein
MHPRPHTLGSTRASLFRSLVGVERRWQLAVATLVLAGAALVLVSTAKYGAGRTPDDYVDVATSLAEGKGLVFHDGHPLVSQPPLYPMLLAAAGYVTRHEPAAVANLVNAALFAVAICLSAALTRGVAQRDTLYGLLGLCAILFSRAFADVYPLVLSECLFIPLLLFYLVSADRYRRDSGRLSLAAMTLATALACVTRYIGVSLVLAGAVTIMLGPKVRLRTRLTRASAFAALALAPLGLWVARNYQVAGTLFGNRYTSGFTLAQHAARSAKAIALWYAPERGAGLFLLGGSAIILVAIVAFRAARARIYSSLKYVLSDHLAAVLLLASFTFTLVGAATRDAVVKIDSRLLSPVYVPATIVLLSLAKRVLSPPRPSSSALIRKTPEALLALWLCLPVQSAVRSAADHLRFGPGGFATRAWRESETVACAKMMSSLPITMYSNDPQALWVLAGVDANWIPEHSHRTETGCQPGELAGRWPPEGEALLVWFTSTKRPFQFSLTELESAAVLVPVQRLSDGSVYRVSAQQSVTHDTAKRLRLTASPTTQESVECS